MFLSIPKSGVLPLNRAENNVFFILRENYLAILTQKTGNESLVRFILYLRILSLN